MRAGPLIHLDPLIQMSDSPALISTEDVSRIRQHINRDGAPPAEVVFRPVNALEGGPAARHPGNDRGRAGTAQTKPQGLARRWDMGAANGVVGRVICWLPQLSYY